jgi:integrase
MGSKVDKRTSGKKSKQLTVKAIEYLKPKAKPYEVADGDGLFLTVRPTGSMSFNLRYRFEGRPRNYTIGPAALGLARARELAREVMVEIARGNDPCAVKNAQRAVAKAPRAGDVTNLAERFVKEHVRPNMRPASQRETERLLRIEVLPKLGHKPIHEVARADIRHAIKNIADRGAPIVANRTLSLLRMMFNWARKQDLIETSPVDGLEPPAKERARRRILTADEIRWFWAACDQIGWPFGPLAQMLLLTAARRDEVRAMTWGEVNMASGTWLLAGDRVKSDREHLVPLSPPALRILKALPRVSGAKGFVFTTSGVGPVDGFSRAKSRLDLAMAGARRREDPNAEAIPPWTFHDLRRTSASGMASLEVQPHVVEAVLNHRSGVIKGVAATYNVYAYAAEKRAALAAWGSHVESIVAAPVADVVERPASLREFESGAL